ncbi:MAG: class I SAM-dependent methyltransferase [Acidobacteriota bacterium]
MLKLQRGLGTTPAAEPPEGRGVQVIEAGDIVFSVSPAGPGKLPRPYAYAARTVGLVRPSGPRVLILGLGLGGVAAEMLRLNPSATLVGVDIAQSSIDWVRAHPIDGLDVVHADALDYLESCGSFDLIFDDCFVLVGEDAVRPKALRGVPAVAAQRLRSGGVYVQNTIRAAGGRETPEISAVFRYRRERAFRDWENVLVVASTRPLDEDRWKRFKR